MHTGIAGKASGSQNVPLDEARIARSVPDVRKAVFTRYVKVIFFKGTSLRPVPPGGTSKEARWIDVHEDGLDEGQMAKWIMQAAALPGWGKV